MGSTTAPAIRPAQTIQSGSRRTFPAQGFWCVVGGALGIIAGVGYWAVVDVEEPNPHQSGTMQRVKKDALLPDAPYAEVHFVDTSDGPTHGETTKVVRNVKFEDLRIATFDEIVALDRASHVTELQAHRLGYPLTDEQLATAAAQERAEVDAREQAAKIAAHPDAVALEAQLAEEHRAFVASAEARRAELAAKLSPPT